MNAKTLALIILGVVFLYQLLLEYIRLRSTERPTPENVKDVYDEKTYHTWKQYSYEKSRLSIFGTVVSFLISFLLLFTDAYAAVAAWAGESVYGGAILVLLFASFVETVLTMPLDYYDTMRIEEKYGFNRSTKKTFFVDQVKEFIVSMLLTGGLMCLFILLHQTMGDMVLVLFAVLAFVIVLLIAFLYPVLSKFFNKFTPLEDEELKEKLTSLLTKNGYQVRSIKVMDASRRSTKSNAYFSGFGKMKTIVLYDTLLASATADEICAIFAHEMGHGLHKDTLKNQILSFVNIALLALALWLLSRTDVLYSAFGFERVNYGLAFILMSEVVMALVSPLLELLINWHSRKAEYRADAQAVKEGYGPALISGLKKLSKENFSNLSPSPILVKLTYSHPPLSQRIAAIEKKMEK
ncbi:MAG: M48 family metallopeptidase [Clostridiales bacterium]|nr:M48 family metallopeptidase [Clostridiales bacterium]